MHVIRGQWGRWDQILLWLTAAWPLLIAFLLATGAIHVRLHLGRWPIVYQDEIKGMFVVLHMQVIAIAVAVSPLTAFGWLVGRAIERRRNKAHAVKTSVLLFLGIGLLVALMRLDPFGFIDWYLD